MSVSGSLRIFKNAAFCAGRYRKFDRERNKKRKTAADIRFSAAVLISKLNSGSRISDPPGLPSFILWTGIRLFWYRS